MTRSKRGCWLFCCIALSVGGIVLGSGRASAADAAKKADLEGRIRHWEANLPYCNWNFGPKFPSKYNDKDAGPDDESLKCNDGDSVVLNGLACAGGDDRGCDSVKRSQGKNGRWWRSPKKLYETPGEGSETTFSNDHAMGAWAYIAQTKDREAFRNWMSWIDSNPRCGLTFDCIPTFPRYCQDDRCTFKLVDCPLLDRLALILGESNPVCDPLHNVADLLKLIDLQRQFDDILASVYRIPGSQILRPQIEALRTPFDASLNVLKETAKKAEAIRQQAETYLRATTAGGVALINSIANDRGFALHDVAVAVFVLKKYGGFSAGDVSSAAEILVARDEAERILRICSARPN
jgi:hypothetical protein